MKDKIEIPEVIVNRLLQTASKYPEWELILKTFMDTKELDSTATFSLKGSLFLEEIVAN